jgi:hypothetical protein
MDEAQYHHGAGPCIEAVRSGHLVHWTATDGRWPHLSDEAQRRNVAEVLSLPLGPDGAVLGSLNLYSCTSGAFDAESERRIALLLAEQGGAALATACALSVEGPTVLPRIAGYEVAARYLPAGAIPATSGNWYEAFRSEPDGPVTLAVGDVAGHGLQAASLMGEMRAALRAYAVEGHAPAENLALISRLLAVTVPESNGLLATACVMLLDPQTGMSRVANAGHLPPALRQPDGEVSFVAALGGPALGVEGDGAIGEEFVALAPGATMVFYTDGLVEGRLNGLDAGLGRLSDVLEESVVSVEQLCDRLLQGMFDGRTQTDDVVVVVVHRRPDDA